jgi:hypothetical protein
MRPGNHHGSGSAPVLQTVSRNNVSTSQRLTIPQVRGRYIGCVQTRESGSSRTDDLEAIRTYTGDNNSCHWSYKNGVTTYKRQKSRCVVNGGEETNIVLVMAPPGEYLPWTKRPPTEKGADNLHTSNVDIAGIQRGHFIPSIQRIGSNLAEMFDASVERRNTRDVRNAQTRPPTGYGLEMGGQ